MNAVHSLHPKHIAQGRSTIFQNDPSWPRHEAVICKVSPSVRVLLLANLGKVPLREFKPLKSLAFAAAAPTAAKTVLALGRGFILSATVQDGPATQEKLMNPPSCHDVAQLLHRSYPLFDFTCDRQDDGRYLISLRSRYTSAPRTNVIGIPGNELRTDRQVKDLGMELICGLM